MAQTLISLFPEGEGSKVTLGEGGEGTPATSPPRREVSNAQLRFLG